MNRRAQQPITIRSDRAAARLKLLTRDGRSQAQIIEDALEAVHSFSTLPIFVDESISTARDIVLLADRVDGVNLKLMKTGGITEAVRLIHTARAHGLKVMIGCMGESSLSIAAGAHLAPLFDAIDLDSHLNLINDPFTGIELVNGRVLPGHGPGLGVNRRSQEPAP